MAMIHKVITTQNKQSVVIDDLNLDKLIVVKEVKEVKEVDDEVKELVSPLVEDIILENCDVKVVDRRKK